MGAWQDPSKLLVQVYLQLEVWGRAGWRIASGIGRIASTVMTGLGRKTLVCLLIKAGGCQMASPRCWSRVDTCGTQKQESFGWSLFARDGRRLHRFGGAMLSPRWLFQWAGFTSFVLRLIFNFYSVRELLRMFVLIWVGIDVFEALSIVVRFIEDPGLNSLSDLLSCLNSNCLLSGSLH